MAGAVAMLWAGALRADDDPLIGGKPLSHWLKQLESNRHDVQNVATRKLSEADEGLRPAIVPKLIPLLSSEKANYRFPAAQVLGEYGPLAHEAVPQLLPLLAVGHHARNRAAAAKALGQILKDAPPTDETTKVALALASRFDDPTADVRREAVYACGMIGPAARTCIPLLGRTFRREIGSWPDDFSAWDAAAWTCGRMGALAAEHVDPLLEMLLRTETTEALDAIGKIGPVQANIVPAIVERMEQVSARTVRIQKGPRSTAMSEKAAMAFMQHSFDVLAQLGSASAPAVPFLTRFISTKRGEEQKDHVLGALKALGSVGPAASSATSAIQSILATSDDKALRKAGDEALDQIRGKASAAAK